jgi:RNA polymerase sigma-70 factor (ECF subfamily)
MASMAEELDLRAPARRHEPADAQPLISHDVWLGVVAGDSAGRERFYRVYAEPVYRAIGAWAHSLKADEREDLLSEIFLKAFQAAGSLQDFANLEGWLFGLARNRVIGHCRKRGRSVREMTVADLDTVTRSRLAKGQEPLVAMISMEDRAALTALIDGVLSELPVRQQFVLIEKYKRGKSLSDIARAIRLDEGAVGSLLHRARAAFREKFEHRLSGEKYK